jgi:hypothetical protein
MRLRFALPLALVALMVIPGQAMAGRILITGHDADFHCALSFGSDPTVVANQDQCGYVRKAVNYVRGGAPDPNKPVLVLDVPDFDFPKALDNAFGVNVVPRVIMDPKSPEFAAEPLTTDRYSAILVASDDSCGGCDLNPPDPSTFADSTADSQAINRRSTAIRDFFNSGGGVYANAGATHGDGTDASDIYYKFIPVPANGVPVTTPFRTTAVGTETLGLFDPCNGDVSTCSSDNLQKSDINCCATHNSFQLPTLGSYAVAEQDSPGFAETLITDGTITGRGVSAKNTIPPRYGTSGLIAPVKGTVKAKPPGFKSFGPLEGVANIPVGTVIDTKKGTVKLSTESAPGKGIQAGSFNGGTFKFTQPTKGAAKGLTDLALTGKVARCSSRGASAAAKRPSRRLFGNAKGKFRTKGKYAAATVRGTKWKIEDFCDGTKVTVSSGSVKVQNLRTKKITTAKRGRPVFVKG